MYLIIHYFDINFDFSRALDRDGFRTRSTGAYICHSARRSNHSATGQGLSFFHAFKIARGLFKILFFRNRLVVI